MSVESYHEHLAAARSRWAEREDDPSEAPRARSRIRQIAVPNLDDESLTLLSSGARDVVVVLVPEARSAFKPWFKVPSGVNCVLETWGKCAGIADPGLHVRPATRVAYAVTKQWCAYDAPVARCPTADNVLCSVDVAVVFSIVDPQAFVYKLGAARLDALLRSLIPEAIRKLVRGLRHTQVHALHGSQAGPLLRALDSGLAGLGVKFREAKITGARLPRAFANKYEKIAKMELKFKTIAKEHEYNELFLRKTVDLQLAEIGQRNEQLEVQEQEKARRAKLQEMMEVLKVRRDCREATLRAEEQAQVKRYAAQAQFRRAENEARRWELQQLGAERSQLFVNKVHTEAEHLAGLAKSSGEVVVAKATAATIRRQGIVDSSVGPFLELQRAHEFSLLCIKEAARIAEHGRFNIVGLDGDAFIASMLNGELDGESLGLEF